MILLASHGDMYRYKPIVIWEANKVFCSELPEYLKSACYVASTIKYIN